MPRRERSLAENLGKAAASAAQRGKRDPTPMENFRELARRVVNVPREELQLEQARYDAANAVRRGPAPATKGQKMNTGRKITVPLPTGGSGEGEEIHVEESSEKWSEFTLQDGTVLRVKVLVTSAVRVDGEYDAAGNPLYMVNFAPITSIAYVPENLRKKGQ